MKKIRSFIYLNNYKMYSISSQLFEGLTEYIVTSKSEGRQDSESQKGPVGSGKILGDIIQQSNNQTEKKFLHDYSYNLFEEYLNEQNKVLELNIDNIEEKIDQIKDYSFVKIKARVVFNDHNTINNIVGDFNKIGYAFGYITKQVAWDTDLKKKEEEINKIKDRNEKARAKLQMKGKFDNKKDLEAKGLYLEDKYLEQLKYLLEFGYNQQIEVQSILSDSCMFSAQLDRTYLKDTELNIIKKYSRETEKEFELFGVLTQVTKESEKERILSNKTSSIIRNQNSPNMKESIMNMIMSTIALEKSFHGKLDYEYIVDPIALYLEL